jgi:hypothetical protein
MRYSFQLVALGHLARRGIEAEPIVGLIFGPRAAAVGQTDPFTAITQGLGEAAAREASAQHQPLQGRWVPWVDTPMGLQYICISP